MTFATAVLAFLTLLDEQYRLMRLWRMNNHVVVCGLGKLLTALVHIASPALCDLLNQREIGTARNRIRLEFFNILYNGARALLIEHPAFAGGADRTPPAHLVVVGLGYLGQSLVAHAADAWRAQYPAADRPLRITGVDAQADEKLASLQARRSELSAAWALEPRSIDPESAAFQQADFLFGSDGRCDVTKAYVCIENDSKALAAALELHQRLREQSPEIVVSMSRATGVARLLYGSDTDGPNGVGADSRVRGFGLLEWTCTADLLRGGTHELLARAIHQTYIESLRELGQTEQTNPSMVAWERLPDDLKESNRRAADHIGTKLRTVGCAVELRRDRAITPFAFTAQEVELLAQAEHERWLEEKGLDGWRWGEKRDNEKKLNPNIIPWQDLDDQTKQLNRELIRQLPAWLAEAGFQTYRLKARAEVEPTPAVAREA